MTITSTVRLATIADAATISALSRDLIEVGLPWTWRADRVRQAIRSAEVNVAVIGEPGDLVAFGIMEYLDSDAYLALFAVRADRQRAGIGSALLRWLEASAAAAGAQRIRLDTRRDNDAARTFYNEHGYHELSITRGRYSGAADGIRLEKWLRPRAQA